jgi:hypothetical protein
MPSSDDPATTSVGWGAAAAVGGGSGNGEVLPEGASGGPQAMAQRAASARDLPPIVAPIHTGKSDSIAGAAEDSDSAKPDHGSLASTAGNDPSPSSSSHDPAKVDPLFCPNMQAKAKAKQYAEQELEDAEKAAAAEAESKTPAWGKGLVKRLSSMFGTQDPGDSKTAAAAATPPVTKRRMAGAVRKVQGMLRFTGAGKLEHEIRRDILKSFNRSMLVSSGDQESNTARTLKTILSSDKSTDEMMEFIFDRKRLEHETKHLMHVESIEEKFRAKNDLKRRLEQKAKEAQRRREEEAKDKNNRFKAGIVVRKPSQPILLTPLTPTR